MTREFLKILLVAVAFWCVMVFTFLNVAHASLTSSMLGVSAIQCQVMQLDGKAHDVCLVDGEPLVFEKLESTLEERDPIYANRLKKQAQIVFQEVARAHELEMEARKIEVLGKLEQLSAPRVNVSNNNYTAVDTRVRATQRVRQSA